jgi:hypothetical protein
LLLLQEVYQQSHPVLFSDRAVYVIVYNPRTDVTEDHLNKHVRNVTVRCKDAPIVLVGTHLDGVGGEACKLPLEKLKVKSPQARCPSQD